MQFLVCLINIYNYVCMYGVWLWYNAKIALYIRRMRMDGSLRPHNVHRWSAAFLCFLCVHGWRDLCYLIYCQRITHVIRSARGTLILVEYVALTGFCSVKLYCTTNRWLRFCTFSQTVSTVRNSYMYCLRTAAAILIHNSQRFDVPHRAQHLLLQYKRVRTFGAKSSV